MDGPGPSNNIFENYLSQQHQQNNENIIMDEQLEDESDDEMDEELDEDAANDEIEVRNIIKLIALNQTYVEIIEKLVTKVEQAISKNRELQAKVKNRLNSSQPLMSVRQRNLVPSLPVFPPYFKDFAGMSASLNEETVKIDAICTVDPLMREEKPWRESELKLLRTAVKESINKQQTLSLISKKELLVNKLRVAGAETSTEQKQEWRDEIAKINRRVLYLLNRPDHEVFDTCANDYSQVDWAKISVKDFHNTRTIAQLQMKWCNEQSPRFSHREWSSDEDRRLVEIKGNHGDWVNWDLIAEELGTQRTAFQCFERFSYLQQQDKERRPWTEEEDKMLISLVEIYRVAEEIPWGKIACYIAGRDKFACEYRYQRSLNRELKHGRWTVEEDTLLLNAINKYGPQNWKRVATCVFGRSSGQCRDRWVHVLDDKRKSQPWSWEEHQRLLYGVKIFGRDKCAKIAMLLPGRNNMDVRMRIRLLMRNKIETTLKRGRNIAFRHFALNHLFCKNRRKMAIDKFNQLAQQEQSRESQLATRMGLGSFFIYPKSGTQVDYTIMKKIRLQEFSQYRILGSGRWAKLQKNPNEFGTEELMTELNQLPEHIRNEAIEWIKESDERLIAEQELERQCPEDVDEAREFYAQMFPQERIDQLEHQIDEVLPLEPIDIEHYKKLKTRPPQKLCVKKPKPHGMVRKQRKAGDPAKKRPKKTKVEEPVPAENSAPVKVNPRFRWKDRLMDEVTHAIEGQPPAIQRSYLIRALCSKFRLFDATSNQTTIHGMENEALKEKVQAYMESVLEDAQNEEDDFLRPKEVVFHPGLWEQVKGHVGKEVGAEVASKKDPNFSLRDALRKLMPPCPATMNAMEIYKKRTRLDLMKSASKLFDPVNDLLQPVARPVKTAEDVLDIRLSDNVKNTETYAQLKKHIYRLFFLPMLMQRAQAKLSPAEDEKMRERAALRARIFELQIAQRAELPSLNASTASANVSVAEYLSIGQKKRGRARKSSPANLETLNPDLPSTSAAAQASLILVPQSLPDPNTIAARTRKRIAAMSIDPSAISDMSNMTLGDLIKLNSKVRKQATKQQL